MMGLGIDFGPPEEQQQALSYRSQPPPPPPQGHRKRTMSTPNSAKPLPSAPKASSRPAPGHHGQRPNRPSTMSGGRLPSPQRRVRIASGQPGILGHGAGHTTDEDIFSSPEPTSERSFGSSASSSSAVNLQRIRDPRINVNARLSVVNSSSSASESELNYDSLLSSNDLSASSPSGTETSATSYASSAPTRGLSMRKQASQPNLSLRAQTDAPRNTTVGPPVAPNGTGLPRSQSSNSLAPSARESGTTLGRASEIRPGSRHTSLRGGRSFSRGRGGAVVGNRVPSHGKTQSWDGGPIPVLCGQGAPLSARAPPESQTPNEHGMIPDGFGGYKHPEKASDTQETSSESDADRTLSRPSPIEESSPEVPSDAELDSQGDRQMMSYESDASATKSTTAPLNLPYRAHRNDSVAASEASVSSSASSYTSGSHPQRALRVGSFYNAAGQEAARLDHEGYLARQSPTRQGEMQSTRSSVSSEYDPPRNARARAASMGPSASMMRSPSTGRALSYLPPHRGSVPDSALKSRADASQSRPQTDLVKMRSVRGFQGLAGAEHGEAMVSLTHSGVELEVGEMIIPERMRSVDQDSILESARAEVQADRTCRQTATTRSSLTEELSGNALPDGKALAHSRSATKLGLSRSLQQSSNMDAVSNSNLERHGTLINPASNPARRSRDLQRLLGDSRRKATSGSASESERSSRSNSPVKGSAAGLQRSNAVGSTSAPPAILEQGRRKEARVDVDVMLESDLVVEGGMLRGRLEVKIRKPVDGEGAVFLAQPKVRVVGFEELIGAEDSRHIFFHHACLVHGDQRHPGGSQPFVLHGSPNLSSPEAEGCPPLPCFSSQPDHEGYSAGREGTHSIPFNMEVPIGKGAKGSYRGKHAHVRYIVIGSIKLKDSQGGNRSIAHFYRHVELFPYLNPAIVLASAPKAIQVSGEKGLFLGGSGKVRVVASLHRGTWVAGQRVYVNVAVQNGTSKKVNSITLTLIRTVTLFRPRPELNVKAGESSDMDPDACTTSTTRKKVTEELLEMGQKGSRGFVTAKGWWTGVEANTNLDFSHHLAIPADALTIPRGRHVEISYHVRVSVGSSLSADVSVELPLRVVNFMSLDPPPLKSAGSSGATRTWATTSTTARGSVASDEGGMIAMVKSADALRSPGRVEIGRGQPNLPSNGPSHLLALSQRAAMRNGANAGQQPQSQTLQAPEDPARRLQHQKSLDFINHAIRSATARRLSNQKPEDGALPMGLGIDVSDGFESSSGETIDTDADATPTGSTVSSFGGGSERGSVRSSSQRSRQSAIHPSCMPYEHIDVPAPSFGFPFVQLPAVSVDDAGEDSDDEDAGNRTLGLNDDSVDEVDMVVGSARLNGDAFERMPQHDGDESVDPDMSTDTIRGDESIGAEAQQHHVKVSSDDEPGEELALPEPSGRRPSVIVDHVSPEKTSPMSDSQSPAGKNTQRQQVRAVVKSSRASLAVAPRLSASTPPRTLAPTAKRSTENLRKQTSSGSLQSIAAQATTPTSPSKAAGAGVRALPASKDAPSPSKPALKNKSSFTFATSEAPLRIAKTGPSTTTKPLAIGPKAKVTRDQLPPKSTGHTTAAGEDRRNGRPSHKEPTIVSVPAPELNSPSKSLASPTKSDRSSASGGMMSDASPATSHEALTPESAHGELPGQYQEPYFAEGKEDGQVARGLGLVMEEGSGFSDGEGKAKQVKTFVSNTLARSRREMSAEPVAPSSTAHRVLRHSNSTASLTGERLQRSHSNKSSSVTSRQGAQANSTAATIRGTNVTVPSVRNKIAMLESRQQALRDFTRPASGSWGSAGSNNNNNNDSASNSPISTPPRRMSRVPVAPASEPRPLAHKTSRSSLVPRDLARQSSKASLACSEASTVMSTSTSSSAAKEWMRRDSIASNASFKAPMLRKAA